MAQVVPVQIDFGELVAIDSSVRSCPRGLDAVGQQNERLPRRTDRALVLAARPAEHIRLWAEKAPPFENLREASLRLERNAARLRVLRVLSGNDDLMRVPEHMTVLGLQHLAEPAGGLQGANDSIPHRRARERVFGAIELLGRFQ